MTKDETLDWLYRLKSEIYIYMPRPWLIPMGDALDMAIKALEQEPCEDAVSRQAVIEIDLDYVIKQKYIERETLDKIRAEIEELKPNNPNFKGYYEQNVAVNKVLEVIDKYKAENEDKE